MTKSSVSHGARSRSRSRPGRSGAMARAMGVPTPKRVRGRTASRVYRRTKRRVVTRSRSRTRSRSSTVTSRKRSRESNGMDVGQISYVKRTYGRRLPTNAKTAIKFANLGDDNVVMRWQRTLPYQSAVGALDLNRYQSTALVPPVLNSTENMPLYLFDLSAITYNLNAVNDIPNVCWQLKRTYQGAAQPSQYSFTQVLGEASDGFNVNAKNWDVERGNKANPQPEKVRRDILKWVQAQLICVGATTVPTKFTIQIVRFTEDYCHPQLSDINTTNTQSPSIYFTRRHQFWENELMKYIASPISMIGNKRVRIKSEKRVLHTVSFTLDPKTNIELDAEGNYKVVKLFKWMNKIQDYTFLNQTVGLQQLDPAQTVYPAAIPVGTMADSWGQPAVAQSTLNYYQNVDLKYRTYLLVKAENYNPLAQPVTPQVDPKYTPSFDIILRKGHMVAPS